jgi:hypothetical protein
MPIKNHKGRNKIVVANNTGSGTIQLTAAVQNKLYHFPTTKSNQNNFRTKCEKSAYFVAGASGSCYFSSWLLGRQRTTPVGVLQRRAVHRCAAFSSYRAAGANATTPASGTKSGKSTLITKSYQELVKIIYSILKSTVCLNSLKHAIYLGLFLP